jgi:hypothetical protein
VTNLQLTWTEGELLADDDIVEPLFAAGVRCHGGFAADGTYRPPRTKYRVPAIVAWQDAHRANFGTEILDAPLDLWPPPYPSVAQTKYLLREGVTEPMATQLTRIGTVEGFGAIIRNFRPGDLQRFFDESIAGTALAHLQSGLFEAHARDEAGWEREAGHNQMWFAARDIAFEAPLTTDQTETMLVRLGARPADGRQLTPEEVRAAAEALRRFPDLDLDLEMMLRRMVSILFIEISAFHTFAWAEEVLSDDSLVAGEGAAAAIVRCIRADETPHVDYLRTALTEVRDRTLIGDSGTRIAGRDVITTLWGELLELAIGTNHRAALRAALSEVEQTLTSHPRGGELLEGFHAHGTIRPTADGELAPVATY